MSLVVKDFLALNDKDDKNKLYCDYNYRGELILSFRSPFICKSNIYKLNHIIYNGNSVLNCSGSIDVFVSFKGYYG